MLLKQGKAFSSFSVNDVPKAKDFYGKTLGLDVSESNVLLRLHLDLATKRSLTRNPITHPQHLRF